MYAENRFKNHKKMREIISNIYEYLSSPQWDVAYLKNIKRSVSTNIGENLWVLAENGYGLKVAIFCKQTR